MYALTLIIRLACLVFLAPYAVKEFVLFLKFTLPVPESELFTHLGKSMVAFYLALCIIEQRFLFF